MPCLLLAHSRDDPATHDFNLLFRPRPVARHGSVLEAPEYFWGIFAHVAIRPKIEYEAHRLAIHPSEKGLDVLGKNLIQVPSLEEAKALVARFPEEAKQQETS